MEWVSGPGGKLKSDVLLNGFILSLAGRIDIHLDLTQARMMDNR